MLLPDDGRDGGRDVDLRVLENGYETTNRMEVYAVIAEDKVELNSIKHHSESEDDISLKVLRLKTVFDFLLFLSF